jgi:hypothetical protein
MKNRLNVFVLYVAGEWCIKCKGHCKLLRLYGAEVDMALRFWIGKDTEENHVYAPLENVSGNIQERHGKYAIQTMHGPDLKSILSK